MRLIHIIATVIASISMLVNCMTANATNSVKTRLQNRYVLAGHVDEIDVFLRKYGRSPGSWSKSDHDYEQ